MFPIVISLLALNNAINSRTVTPPNFITDTIEPPPLTRKEISESYLGSFTNEHRIPKNINTEESDCYFKFRNYNKNY